MKWLLLVVFCLVVWFVPDRPLQLLVAFQGVAQALAPGIFPKPPSPADAGVPTIEPLPLGGSLLEPYTRRIRRSTMIL